MCPYSCPANLCPKGQTLKRLPGDCCPSCVPDPDACSQGAAAYQALLEQLLAQPSALSCSKDSDCTILAPNASCGDPCATHPVSVTAAMSIEPQLSQLAGDQCAGCPALQVPCTSSFPVLCIDGTCAFGGRA